MATTAVNAAGANGLLHGGSDFFVKQLVAVVVSSIYAFAFTYAMLWIINKATPVRTTEVEEGELDSSLHGESAYEAL
jgi:Amt family ammonium transporter